jgi:pimeloyl-[acyl-carrier protein] methyl ester esterase
MARPAPVSSQLPKLILLPGLDGTGELFTDFVKALPNNFETLVLRYPTDRFLSYKQLAAFVTSAISMDHPSVLVAESFSTPLAIQLAAATTRTNLKGIVLCAGFVSSPVGGLRRLICSLLSPVAFRFVLPEFAARLMLVGPDPQSLLLAAVRHAVSSVKPSVLSGRLNAVLACDVRPELKKVAVPILYLQARQDRLVSRASLEEIQRIKPETSVSVIAGPHLLLQRESQSTATCVADFVRQLV